MKAFAEEKITSVDQYIASFPPAIRKFLKEVRKTVLHAAPQAEEVMSYNMPALKLNSILVYYAGWKKHIGFYPMPSTITAFKNELGVYTTSKGAIQFPLDQPVPYDLIRQMVLFRAEENLEKTKTKIKKK